MVKRVRTPDGYANFPDSMSDEEIERVLAREYPSPAVQQQNAQARQQATQPQAPAGPNRAQATEAARMALERQVRRSGGNVLGLGIPAQALTNLVTTPSRREEARQATGRLVRDAQQISSLNLPQLARDTAGTVESAVRGVAARPLQSAGAFLGALPGALWEATGVPSAQREERAQQDIDLARIQGDPAAERQAARRANEATATLGLTVAAPLALGGSTSMLRAGTVGAGAAAPFALNRNSDQPLQQRLPAALAEIGTVGAISGGFQAGANRLGQGAARREAAIDNIRRRTQEFDQAGVRPFLAAVRGSSAGKGATDSIAAPLTMGIAENIVGGNVRRNLSGAVQDVARGAQRLAGRYGEPQANVVAGESVQGAIRRYSRGRNETPVGGQRDPWSIPTRDWSLPQKAEALYDDTFETLANDARQQQIGGVQGEILTLANTQRVMDRIVGGISGNRSRERLPNQTLRTLVDEMTADLDDGSLSFADMRRWRSTIREMKGDDQLRQGISRGELDQIYNALTADIYQSADNIGGQAAQDLRRIDDWYRRESAMIEDQLSHYYGAERGETATRRIILDARSGGNLRRLQALSEALRDDQRRTLAASIINDLGAPPKGRAHLGEFDLEAFVTNYQDMTPAARQALFGGRGLDTLADDLASLQRVAGYMKEVRGFTNWSRSGQATQNFASMTAAASAVGALVGSGNIIPAFTVALGAISLRLTGTLLTNPRVVRLLVQAPKAGQTAAGARAWMRRLAELAARDPAVAALLGAEISPAADRQSGVPPTRQPETAGQQR